MTRVGVDLIEIERVRRSLERYEGFRDRCFTPAEQAYCDSRKNPAESYAGRFAGKEAVGKALGFGVARAFAWKDIEIAGRPKPSVRLSGRVAAWAERVDAGAIDPVKPTGYPLSRLSPPHPLTTAPAALQDPPDIKALKYRLIGPAWGGRVSRVAGVPGN